jgi:dsDNA-specific endonuclease/ATPase MutS2
VSEKSQANIKSLEELEKKLEEADQEAEGVRQEYMALYARNQREKETYKKK